MACIPALSQDELKAMLYLENRQLTDTLRGIAAKGDVVGFDFCEVAPVYDPSNITCQVAARVILDFLGAIFHERKKRAS